MIKDLEEGKDLDAQGRVIAKPEIPKEPVIKSEDLTEKLRANGKLDADFLADVEKEINGRETLSQNDIKQIYKDLESKYPSDSDGYGAQGQDVFDFQDAANDTFRESSFMPGEAKPAIEPAVKPSEPSRPSAESPQPTRPAAVEAEKPITPAVTRPSTTTVVEPSRPTTYQVTEPPRPVQPSAPSAGAAVLDAAEKPGMLGRLTNWLDKLRGGGIVGNAIAAVATAGAAYFIGGASASEAAEAGAETFTGVQEANLLAQGQTGAAVQTGIVDGVSIGAGGLTAAVLTAGGAGVATAVGLPILIGATFASAAQEGIDLYNNGGMKPEQAALKQQALVEKAGMPETVKFEGKDVPILEALRDPKIQRAIFKAAENSGDRNMMDFLGAFNGLEAIRLQGEQDTEPRMTADATPSAPQPVRPQAKSGMQMG